MKNYTFVEIDASNSVDIYALEQDNTLFQRYQAQLRWCNKHLSSFRSQIKTIIRSSTDNATFVQATPFNGQQLQPYHLVMFYYHQQLQQFLYIDLLA